MSGVAAGFAEGLRLDDSDASGDLIIVALADVQRFIAESRTTADLSSASRIIAELSAAAAEACRGPGARIVFPAVADDRGHSPPATPNKVIALVVSGDGEDVARRAAAAVKDQWHAWVREAMGHDIETPGMPNVQWVVVPAGAGGYAYRWERGQAALTARKRVRDHPGPEWTRRQLCTQSPRWPAVKPPARARRSEQDLQISAANWVKRQWRAISRRTHPDDVVAFPSTSSIASAPYRQAILRQLDAEPVRAAVSELHQAWQPLQARRETPVAGLEPSDVSLAKWFADTAGVWVYPASWHADGLRRDPEVPDDIEHDAVARRGMRAASALVQFVSTSSKAPHPATPYLALVAQDLDNMGRFLSGLSPARDGHHLEVTAAVHHEVSKRLEAVARAQREALEVPAILGTPVYTGGDDLLAFVPAGTALAAARVCHDAVPAGLPTASTAVLFFHRTSSLRHAVAEVRQMLEDAKKATADRGKHALAVGFMRRSGVREHSIQQWLPDEAHAPEQTAANLFETFVHRGERSMLSPRLVNELERDGHELGHHALPDDVYRAEIARLVGRHGGTAADAEALVTLGHHECASSPKAGRRRRGTPERAARVAVFLRQECQPYDTPAGGMEDHGA